MKIKAYSGIVFVLIVIGLVSFCSSCVSGPEAAEEKDAVKEEVTVEQATESEQPAEPEGRAEPQEEKEPVEKYEGEEAFIAISEFAVLSDDASLAFLETEIPEALTRGFIRGGVVKPVERKELDRVIEELKLSMSGLTDEKYTLEAGKILGADYILFGSFSKIGPQVKISYRLVDTETSEIIHSDSGRGMYEALFDVEDELCGNIETYFSR